MAESVRRIRTIALVHETLSREPGDDVAFLEIVRPLLRLAEEGLQSPDRPVRFTVQGDGGRLPSTVATPLSVVLTELLQNAVDHGFPEGSGGGDVVVVLDNVDHRLSIRVVNDGRPSGPRLRAQSGHWSRPVDRAHPGHHRTRRHDLDAAGPARRLPGRGSGRPAAWHAARSWISPSRSDTRTGRAGQTAVLTPGRPAGDGCARRSSSLVPPQMPESWLVSRA